MRGKLSSESKRSQLSPIDKQRVTSLETIFIGIIAKNMGCVNQSDVVKSGEEIFKRVGSLTYRELKNIKSLLKETKN